MAMAGVVVMLLFPPSNALLVSAWESNIRQDSVSCDGEPDLLVVLPGGVRWQPDDAAASARLSDETIHRLGFGLELYQQYPEAQLLVAGSSTEAYALTRFLERLAVIDTSRIRFDRASWSTDRAAARMARLADGYENIWVVTSATHQRRSRLAFLHHSVPVCLRPSHYAAPQPVYRVVPGAREVEHANRLLHETIGYAWYYLNYALGRSP